MTILVVYSEEPKFPASDQRPEAIRYHIGNWWVDATEGAPTQFDLDTWLTPVAPTPERDPLAEIDAMKAALVSKRVISEAEIDAQAVRLDSISLKA